jgi:hypothetical protein
MTDDVIVIEGSDPGLEPGETHSVNDVIFSYPVNGYESDLLSLRADAIGVLSVRIQTIEDIEIKKIAIEGLRNLVDSIKPSKINKFQVVEGGKKSPTRNK